ncbi:ABC transporter ATP-binding protein [Aquimarina agarilytica]|uniref:ABC transporter ATP-binding protein n=1 Tax=Aquimarina agarilytica TaxID=1087449 RepID=UPI000287F8D3|nr:ABC transporter ATP-binding protein [Aquimarina agarilytica]
MSEKNNPYDLSVLKKLVKFTSPYKGVLFLVTLTAILTSVFALARPQFLQQAIDQGVLGKNKELLLYFILFMLGSLLLEVLSQLTFIFFANWLGQHVVRDLRTQLFKRMLNFKMQYYDNAAVGRLVTRAVNDIEKIAEIFSQGLFMIISDLLKMTAIVGIMLYNSWRLTLIVFLMLPIIVYATRVFHKKMKVAFENVRTEVSNLNTFVQEHISGMKIVQLFAREKVEHEKFKAINEKHKNAWIKTVWYNSIFFPIAELSGSIAVGFLVWYGGLRSIESVSITLGLVVMFIELTNMLFRPLRQIADKFNTLQMGMVAARRVFKELELEEVITQAPSTKLTSVKGVIDFDDVRFSYLPGEEVLKGITFNVKAGQTVAIVGSTGAGKSTIINLLNRFYQIDSGDILIDGTSIHHVSLANLRSNIAVVLQDVFLFADTIFKNITLGNENITLAEVKQAAKEIGVHEFIMQLPNNYEYNVKERGSMLSSGQRQLISFLRAYVSKPSILVLDEATSSVDTYSEQLIQKATEKITQNRTSIVIAHRLATIVNADVIIVMDKGEIVEQGSHKELLKKSAGYYKNLYEVQFAEAMVN